MDINDSKSLNKILDEAASAHVQRALNRNPLRRQGGKVADVTEASELEQTLKLAIKPNEIEEGMKKIEE